jgi:hypothetical protein
MDNWEHLPVNLIKDFVYGDAALDELQLHHSPVFRLTKLKNRISSLVLVAKDPSKLFVFVAFRHKSFSCKKNLKSEIRNFKLDSHWRAGIT